MSWPGFLAPSAAWFFLLVPPLVLLYFLKLKRPLLRVPSLALWAQVMEDRRVNSPLQRFRRNILLWLQLLLLCLLVLAAMSPYVRGGRASDRVLVLLDCSASMGALDKPSGETRFAVARRRIAELIDGLAPRQEAAIVAIGSIARQAVPFTTSARVLRDGLDHIEVDDVEGDLVDGLRMADAMARSAPFDRVLLYSDGNVQRAVDFDLPFALEFEKLAPGGPNLGITDLRARRTEGGGWSVFVRVQASEGAEIPCTLEVLRDGKVEFTQPVHAGPGGERFVFPVAGAASATLTFALRPQGFDSLAIDNEAVIELGAERRLRVLVAGGGSYFEHALRVLDGVEVSTAAAPDAPFDLVIANGPDGEPAAPTSLHTGYVPADLRDIVKVEVLEQGTDTVIDWQRHNPLLEHVEMGDLFLGQRVSFAAGMQEINLDGRRYEALAHGSRAPVIVQKEDGGLLRYHVLVDLARTTLPYRVGFPILCRNLVTIAMQRAGLLEVEGVRTGVLPPVQVGKGEGYSVTVPGGSSRSEPADERGLLRGISAPRIGRYRIERGGEERILHANLLSPQETLLGTVDRLQLHELSVDAGARIRTDRSLWSWFAAVALAVLAVEWWFFQARPGGYTTRHA